MQQLTGKISLIQKRYINTLRKLLEERGNYGNIKTLFDDTLNRKVGNENLIIIVE